MIKGLGSVLALVLIVLFAMAVFALEHGNESQTGFDLEYELTQGQQFEYNCTYISQGIEPLYIDISNSVSSVDGNNITLNVTTVKMVDGNVSETSFVTVIDRYGNVLQLDQEDELIPEIQPEFPNLLSYPERTISEGDTWSTSFKKTLGDEQLEGTRKYVCIGQDIVSTDAGDFECIGIYSETNFISISNRTMENFTIGYTTVGNISGEEWVDIDKGFLIRSEYHDDRKITIDLSEVYQKLNIEYAYQEQAKKHDIINELERIENR